MGRCSIEHNQLEKLYNYAKEIYANMNLLKAFCETNKSSENLYIIKPLVEYTYKTSDNLYASLIEMNCHKETIL